MRKQVLVGIALLALTAPTLAQTAKWFRFRKDFVAAAYPDGIAAGDVRATAWARAQNAHSVSCGGNDGELHIGIFDPGIDVPDNERPPSAPLGPDAKWGVVAELPDVKHGDGRARLDDVEGHAVTFTGYFRVWNEGHDNGNQNPPASNPHHVLELHPTWAFTSDGTSFSRKDLVRPMAGYHGYGATKFKPVLAAVQGGDFPKAYQDQDYVYVSLLKEDNFYQLPVEVQSVQAVTGGHEATVDVYSDTAFQHQRYTGLRCVTITDTDYDGEWEEGTQDTLLGFFSINLKKCLDASTTATTKETAVHVPDALEFFVFGHATGRATASCP